MSAAPDRAAEADALRRLRLVADRMRGDEWVLDTEGSGFVLWTRRSTGEQERLCTIHPSALTDERQLIAEALCHVFLFLGLFDRAAVKCRDLERQLGRRAAEARKGDYAAQAAMLLSDRGFQRFLDGKGSGAPVRDAATADTRLKFLLGVTSKKDFNTNDRARAAWQRLAREFDAWKRGELP